MSKRARTEPAAHIKAMSHDRLPLDVEAANAAQRHLDAGARVDAVQADARQEAAAYEAAQAAEEAAAHDPNETEELELRDAISVLQRAQFGQKCRCDEGPAPRTRDFLKRVAARAVSDSSPGGNVCVCVHTLFALVCVVCRDTYYLSSNTTNISTYY